VTRIHRTETEREREREKRVRREREKRERERRERDRETVSSSRGVGAVYAFDGYCCGWIFKFFCEGGSPGVCAWVYLCV
jgi:hypothetical protein